MMDSRVELIDSIIAHLLVCIVCIDVCCHEAGMGHAHIGGGLEMLEYEERMMSAMYYALAVSILQWDSPRVYPM